MKLNVSGMKLPIVFFAVSDNTFTVANSNKPSERSSRSYMGNGRARRLLADISLPAAVMVRRTSVNNKRPGCIERNWLAVLAGLVAGQALATQKGHSDCPGGFLPPYLHEPRFRLRTTNHRLS